MNGFSVGLSCLKFDHEVAGTWPEARAHCSEQYGTVGGYYIGGRLLEISTQQQMDFVRAALMVYEAEFYRQTRSSAVIYITIL